MKKVIFLSIAIITIYSCGRFGNEDKKKVSEERIVCISKQYSEIIYALGAEENIVAVDVSSTYPPEIKDLPTIGYHRALAAEPILSMKPTLILEDNNIGPEHVVTQLKNLKIPMKQFGHYENTIAGTDSLIREMGSYFHKEEKAEELCKKLDADMNYAKQQALWYEKKPKLLVIHFGQANNIYLVMTKNSTAGKLIDWAGGEMAVDGERGMTQFSPEVVAQSDPDVILLTDFGYDKLGSTEEVGTLPGISSTRAFKEGKVYRVEEHDMVYLGPRTGENIIELQKLIHQ
ncbi:MULTISPECIES: hemin ABC transporter substrate-binding protein [Aequorivita]|uniref:ABC transporter substrate-binding protein n=1 Tax=Aequorivita iocasae TaxID=2803865 RepID=A0ABX7DWC3_9FLAO|nr:MULTISPECIES: ABC transporter substrate-binding protein [Aequorivita]QQX78085.1 ABC transporter substrate-binding protein [Aequorivita iocasae]UCA57594.1 ABC transporter substrate-binding protein [Aequorivita sp. F7]